MVDAFRKAWNLIKSSLYHRVLDEKEIRHVVEMNQQIQATLGPMDADPSVNYPAECHQCHSQINNILEGLPKSDQGNSMCSRCIHPWVDERILDSMEIQGLFGDDQPFDLNQALEGNETASALDFIAFRDAMGDME